MYHHTFYNLISGQRVHQQERNVRPVRLDASGAPGAGARYFAKSLFMTDAPTRPLVQVERSFSPPPRRKTYPYPFPGARPFPTYSPTALVGYPSSSIMSLVLPPLIIFLILTPSEDTACRISVLLSYALSNCLSKNRF